MKPFYNGCVATLYANPGVISSSDRVNKCATVVMKQNSTPVKDTTLSKNLTANGHVVKETNNVVKPKIDDRGASFKTHEVRKRAGESFEECSLWDAFCTYLCYAVLVIVGYVNDLVRPRTANEKHRDVRQLFHRIFYILKKYKSCINELISCVS